MTLYTVLLGIQYASVFLMLLECVYTMKKWSRPLHGWLFFYCVTVLVNNTGYLAYMQAQTEEAAVLSWQFLYLGKAWTGFSLLMLSLELCHGRTYGKFTTPLSLANVITYASVLTLRHNGFYYKSVSFVQDGLFPHLVFRKGPWHHVFDAIIGLYMLVGLTVLFRSMKRQQDRRRKRQVFLILLAVLTDSLFCLLQMSKLVPLYDMNTVGFTIASVLLFIAMFFFDILDSRELARDFVMENISEGIVVTDEDGGLATCNGKGRKLLEALAPGPDGAIAALQNLAATGSPLKDAGKTYSITEEFLKNRKGAAGRVYLLTDETEHYQYIAELKEQKQIADKANNAKSEFLSNMSHEIRSPINAVLGLDEMILRESGEQAIRGYAADIQSSGTMLLSVINDILDFSKIESGKMEIIPVDYDLSRLISDLVTMTAPRAEGKGLEFIVQVDEAMPRFLTGDEIRIKQCVLNILTNAVKYTARGSVTLSVGAEQTGEAQCTLYFSVTDTGIGIKEEDSKKLFSPFERIEEGRNRAIEGTGLGMSIVKSLLSAMASTLEVESVYGKGSRFSFHVSQKVRDWQAIGDYREAKARELARGYAYAERFQAPGAKVLVVDDTPVNLTVMRGLLKQTRIQVDTADGGPAALEKTRTQPYDIIFIDHRMPRMDGIQTLAALRAEPENPNRRAACIALTANVTGDIRKLYLDAGFEDYLAKPIEPKKLEETIERHLPASLVLHAGDAGWEEAAPAGGREACPQTPKAAASAPAGGRDPSGMLLEEASSFFKQRFGLDLSTALTNCGSGGVFQDVVSVFRGSIDGRASDIERYAAKQDWQDYTVQVHALKSSARLIGAAELGTMAAALEALGNRAQDRKDEEAVRTIQADTGLLLERYRSYKELLAPLCTASGQGS